MTARTTSLHTTANLLRYRPQLVRPAKTVARTYEDYLADGRVWAAERLAGASVTGSHNIESLARIYADINAPHAVRAEYSARMQAARDAEFGASGYVVGQYGLRLAVSK